MLVPQFWAEARIQHKRDGKQVTVRRFGWSDISQADAQSNAEARVQEALRRILSGEKLTHREPKVPYHGASGVPIREEIIDRRGDTIITRNSYGALCLNTPNVLFADVDFELATVSVKDIVWKAAGIGLLSLYASNSRGVMFWWACLLMAILAVYGLWQSVRYLHQIWRRFQGTPEQLARQRISRFIEDHPEWNGRLYRTPAGLRIMATHRPFEPNEPLVKSFFHGIQADPIFELMCETQRCFRARVSPKPWRIGMSKHLRPTPGVWPVHPDRLHLREAWVAEYTAKCEGYASCTYLESLGSGVVHHEIRPVMEWHDELSKATIPGLPIA